ncbi:MAG: DUF839 domain-containing protein [Anaerolineae bacterium]
MRMALGPGWPTKMDRPEDIEVSPATGKVYIALTNNDSRGGEGFRRSTRRTRAPNTFGHVIELAEDGGDAARRASGGRSSCCAAT